MATAKTARVKNIIQEEAGETADYQSGALNQPAREEIEQRAYELYQARGGVQGYDQDDWLQAERDLTEAQS